MLTTIFWVTFGITVSIIIFAVISLVSYALSNGVFTDRFLERCRRIPLVISFLNIFTIILYSICIITKTPLILWGMVLIAIQCLAIAVFAIIGINIKFKRIDRFKQKCDYIEVKYIGKINMIYFAQWKLMHLVNPYNMDEAESYLDRYDADMMATIET